MEPAKAYFNKSRGLLYSYLISLPLLLLYEVLILISQPGNRMVRISVDVWFKQFFALLGLNTISATLFIAFLIGSLIVYKKRSQLPSLKKRYFFYMLAEAFVYAILVSLLIGIFLNSLLHIYAEGAFFSMNKLQMIALSLGAGLYEELFFRVILVSLLLVIFQSIFRKKPTAYTLAALIAALIFSAVHYVGDFGDIFTLSSFLFRFLFGLALNLIYVMRGFGMAAWTHALYDIFVVMSR
ncbi:MAG: CPBP family intramembrane glutamic endopeptidase [Balneolaceae bacterium]